jgi:hypothetical protein
MTDGEARLAAESERWRTLDRFFARFEGDLREAVPRPSRRSAGSEPAWLAQPGDSDGNSALAFTRAGPEFVVEPGIAGPADRLPPARRQRRGRSTGPRSTIRTTRR